jgi:lysozyme
MNLNRLEQHIIANEGIVVNPNGLHVPYLDSLDVPTIGHGCTRIFDEKVTMQTEPITDEQAKILLRVEVYTALKDASVFIEDFFKIGGVRQEALVEMAYQLGGPKQRGFERAQAAGNSRQWSIMADEMVDSKWFRQTPRRCQILADMVRTNKHRWQ